MKSSSGSLVLHWTFSAHREDGVGGFFGCGYLAKECACFSGDRKKLTEVAKNRLGGKIFIIYDFLFLSLVVLDVCDFTMAQFLSDFTMAQLTGKYQYGTLISKNGCAALSGAGDPVGVLWDGYPVGRCYGSPLSRPLYRPGRDRCPSG